MGNPKPAISPAWAIIFRTLEAVSGPFRPERMGWLVQPEGDVSRGHRHLGACQIGFPRIPSVTGLKRQALTRWKNLP
jgi:hypothetical protein